MTSWVASICVPVRESLCLFWHETNTKGLRVRSPMRPEGRGKEGPRDQSAGEVSQEKVAAETSWQNRSVKRWESGREETSQQKSERRLLKPVDLQMPGWPTREFKSAFQVALWEFLLKYTLALAHRMHKKCHRLLLALGANPSPCLFVCLFFSSTLSVVNCVSVKECEIPPVRDKKNHLTILIAMSSLVGWDSGGWPAGIGTLSWH